MFCYLPSQPRSPPFIRLWHSHGSCGYFGSRSIPAFSRICGLCPVLHVLLPRFPVTVLPSPLPSAPLVTCLSFRRTSVACTVPLSRPAFPDSCGPRWVLFRPHALSSGFALFLLVSPHLGQSSSGSPSLTFFTTPHFAPGRPLFALPLPRFAQWLSPPLHLPVAFRFVSICWRQPVAPRALRRFTVSLAAFLPLPRPLSPLSSWVLVTLLFLLTWRLSGSLSLHFSELQRLIFLSPGDTVPVSLRASLVPLVSIPLVLPFAPIFSSARVFCLIPRFFGTSTLRPSGFHTLVSVSPHDLMLSSSHPRDPAFCLLVLTTALLTL